MQALGAQQGVQISANGFLNFLKVSRTVSGLALNLSWEQTAFPSGRVEDGVTHSSPGVGRGPGLLVNRGKVKSLSRVRLFSIPWTAAYQAPLPMGFSRQEYWSGVPLPSPQLSPWKASNFAVYSGFYTLFLFLISCPSICDSPFFSAPTPPPSLGPKRPALSFSSLPTTRPLILLWDSPTLLR